MGVTPFLPAPRISPWGPNTKARELVVPWSKARMAGETGRLPLGVAGASVVYSFRKGLGIELRS
jgi:hypothetical protein